MEWDLMTGISLWHQVIWQQFTALTYEAEDLSTGLSPGSNYSTMGTLNQYTLLQQNLACSDVVVLHIKKKQMKLQSTRFYNTMKQIYNLAD